MTATATATTICTDCATSLPVNEEPPSPCPTCGSMRRTVRLELVDQVNIYDGIVAESVDRHGEVVAESVAFDTKQVSVVSHVDRGVGTMSRRVARGAEWERQNKEAEEEAVGRAVAKILEEETGIPWRVQPVPKEEHHPDVRITPTAPTPIAAHEVEVRHLDEAAIKAVNSNRPLDPCEEVQVLAAMFKDAVMKKHGHYDRAWIPRGTLALQVPMHVGGAFVQVLCDKAATLDDGFRELWLVADGIAHRVRPVSPVKAARAAMPAPGKS